jgi:hypothetical protein
MDKIGSILRGEAAQNLQRQKDLITIDMVLGSIIRGQANTSYPEPMRVELSQRLGEMLLPALPTSVTVLDLGIAIISRDAAQIERVQSDLRQTWDMQRVDQYGADLARGLGKPYSPKLPTPGI